MTLTQINKAGLDEIALDHVFTIGASGSSAYTFQGEGLNGTVNNPTLYLTRGKTYRFENGSGGHPIRIQSTSGASGTAYNTGVTNNAGSGTVIVEVQHDAPDVLYYQCTSHAAMNGILYITGALADGGVTTAKIAADAVTTAKIDNGAITAAKMASSSVTNASIDNDSIHGDKLQTQTISLAKLVHGTSSQDGKFLRANNGADPTFETVTSTTINNNANNRIITGSGTANTLEAETGFTYNGSLLHINSGSNGLPKIRLQHSGSGNDTFEISGGLTGVSNGGFGIYDVDASAYRLAIDSTGKVGIKTTSPIGTLDVHDGSFVLSKPNSSGNERNWRFLNNNVAAGNLGLQCSTTAGGSTFSNIIEIKSNGNVGINQSNPSRAKLHVVGDNTDGDIIAKFKSGAGANGKAYIALISGYPDTANDIEGHAYLGVQRNGSGNGTNMLFSVYESGSSLTERLRIRNGGGICFNGDTAAANALDDYEEGIITFAPVNTGVTFSSSYKGRYTKIGELVTVSGYLVVGSLTNSGNTLNVQLPFTSAANGQGYYSRGVGATFSRYMNFPSNYHNMVAYVGGGENYMRFFMTRNSGGSADWHQMTHNNITANTNIYFNVCYTTTS